MGEPDRKGPLGIGYCTKLPAMSTASDPVDRIAPPNWAWVLISLLLGLGAIWLIPYEGHDGVIVGQAVESGDWRGVRMAWLGTNWVLLYPLFRINDWLAAQTGVPYWVWGKLVLSASVCGLAHEARLLSQQVLGLSRAQSAWTGVLVLVFPGWCMLYGTGWMNIVFMWAVFAGHRIACQRSLGLRVCGMLLMLASLQVNSNLVVLPALEAMRWLTGQAGPRPWAVVRSIWVGAAVLGVYALLRWVSPPQGLYAGYNSLLWPSNWHNLQQVAKASAMFATWLALLIPAVMAAIWARQGKHLSSGYISLAPPATGLGLPSTIRHGMAVLLLGFATVFPYIMVGKGAPLFVLPWIPVQGSAQSAALANTSTAVVMHLFDGWNARHTWLMSVPLCIASVLIATGGASPVRMKWWGVVGAWLLSAAWLITGHHAKLSRYLDEQSLVRALQLAPAPPAGEVDLEASPSRRWLSTGDTTNYLMWRAYRQSIWAADLYFEGEPSWRDILLTRRASFARQPSIPGKENLVTLTNLMQDYRYTGCRTHYVVQWVTQPPSALLTSGLWPDTVYPAVLKQQSANC